MYMTVPHTWTYQGPPATSLSQTFYIFEVTCCIFLKKYMSNEYKLLTLILKKYYILIKLEGRDHATSYMLANQDNPIGYYFQPTVKMLVIYK